MCEKMANEHPRTLQHVFNCYKSHKEGKNLMTVC